jgi:GT2 family glycosyltransferase
MVYILRAVINIIQFFYALSFRIFWKNIRINSAPYRFIRKFIRRHNETYVVPSDDPSTWRDTLYRICNTATLFELNLQNRKSVSASIRFGIYLPNPSIDWPAIRQSVDAIRIQSYPHWTLLLSFSKAIDPDQQKEFVEEFHKQYPQISYQLIAADPFVDRDGYVICMKMGDVLLPDALFQIYAQIVREPGSDFVSFDIANITAEGTYSPWFRASGLSPELMISQNCLSHAAIKSTTGKAILEQIGMERPGTSPSDDAILLRMVQNSAVEHRHISKVLYHQLPHPDDAQTRCNLIRAELTRQGCRDAQVNWTASAGIHAAWKTDGKKVSIVIPSKDKPELIRTCIESIQARTDYPNYEIVIVDNHSRDRQTLDYYESLSNSENIRIVHYDEAFNYSRAINLGAAEAGGKYLLFLNNDIQIIHADWLTELVQWALLPRVGIVGAKLLYPDQSIQHAGVVFDPNRLISHVFCHQPPGKTGPHGSENWYRNYVGVTGACQMIRKELFEQLGGYDEQFQLTFSDIDICLRAARSGYRVVYNPFSVSIHHESATRNDNNPTMDIRRAFILFRDVLLAGDPYFSEQVVDAFSPRIRIYEPDRTKIIQYKVDL